MSISKLSFYFVTPQFKTGGGNRVFIEIANCLADLNHHVSIIYPNNSEDENTFLIHEKLNIIKIGTLAFSKIKKILNVFRTIRVLNSLDKETVIITSDPMMCILCFLVRQPNVFRFVQADDYCIFDDQLLIKNLYILKIYKWLTKVSYKYKVRYIFNSAYVYDKFCEVRGDNSIKFDIVHPAINHSVFNNIGEKENLLSQLKIVIVARKHPMKGLSTFINTWKNIDSSYKENIGEITLISHDDLSNFFFDDYFRIVKPTSDHEIADILKTSDIFISTSWWEGFGLPPLEAMACGCAVITSDSGGINEYAIKDSNCLIFEPRNEDELSACLIKLINDKQLRKNLVASGIPSAQKFSWQKSASQLLEIVTK
jgi:glycosyltransferase involved in cell wall biosynthesis